MANSSRDRAVLSVDVIKVMIVIRHTLKVLATETFGVKESS
jgi:hypothetical protein